MIMNPIEIVYKCKHSTILAKIHEPKQTVINVKAIHF